MKEAIRVVRDDLLAQRNEAGHWVGRLSDSALSTATATSALAIVDRKRFEPILAKALDWLAARQNPDGGWGDTDRSFSNVATTMLVRAAVHLAGRAQARAEMLGRAEDYLAAQGGLDALRRRYGKDRTFAVPILTNAALAGLERWDDIAALPFELACLPHWMLRFLHLPVVSYALPALVAIGQAKFLNQPPRNPFMRWIRRASVAKSLEVLTRIQPGSGGFLEATPLTSFVVMSLAATGRTDHPVVRRGVDFLIHSMRDDGAWPIDTNLATWNTTLAVNALAASGEDVGDLECLDWLFDCQHRHVHPFTQAAPGGWGWTDLSGAVPDADDTPGALLALAAFHRSPKTEFKRPLRRAATAGIEWLLNLQNRDGGFPTFCRGWGALPFDRSGVDLTAHALRAFWAWRDVDAEPRLVRRMDRAIERGLAFLDRRQQDDGSWSPLWFGNQNWPNEENPVYGTGRVLLAYRDLGKIDSDTAQAGLQWLVENRAADGGWGGTPASEPASESSVEETAVAVEALLAAGDDPAIRPVARQGVDWLVEAVLAGRHWQPTPIGLYFARLWYYETMYPLVFAASALGRALASGID